MFSWPVPEPGMPRDACTCLWLPGEKTYQHAPGPLCQACRAWEDGYVLIEGRRQYLRAMWKNINTAATLNDRWQ